MRMDFDLHNPKVIGAFVGAGLVAVLVYWLIWRKYPRTANYLVLAVVVAVICATVDWHYVLVEYFFVNWKLP